MSKEDDAILKEIRERLSLSVSVESEERRESEECFDFVYGNQWPDDMRRLRQIEQRPALTNNRLPAFVNQVVNDIRQNRPGIKVHPVDGGADIETAEVMQGLIRHIEYASNADFAYDTSVAHACIGGRGFFRLVTDYCDEKSFEQDIKFARVPNPFTVYFDPFSTEPDGSDARYCIITDLIPRADFEAQYGKTKATDTQSMLAGPGDGSVMWLSQESVRVAEYYRVEVTREKLHRMNDGSTAWESEQPDPFYMLIGNDGKPVTRISERRKVCWYKVTAVDVLETVEVPCKWIPVFPVYGEEHIVNGKIKRCGMIKHAKDPMKMFNFWTTSATEEVSMRPKTPYIGAVGQFETAKKDWQQANKRSFSFLEYDPVDVNGAVIGAPQRQQMADVPSGAIAMLQLAEGNIKATMGLFDASMGARGNATSGRQELAQQREGATATFHFSDNLGRTIRHAGRCLVAMVPRVFDTQRIVRVLGIDGKMDSAELNKPLDEPQQTEQGGIKTVLNDLQAGKYDMTLSTGPSYQTKRQEQSEAMMQLGQAAPQIWGVAGDLLIRSMDWNDADEIADRIKRSIPPEIIGEDDPNQQSQIPPQVQQVLQQAQQEIQQLQQALQQATQEAQSGMQAKQLDAEVKLRLADMNNASAERVAAQTNDTKHDIAELAGMVQMLLQRMQPPPELAAAVSADTNESQPTGEAVA